MGSPMLSCLRFTIWGLTLRVFKVFLAGPAPILVVLVCWCENLFSKKWFRVEKLSFWPLPRMVLMLLGFRIALCARCSLGVYYSYLFVGMVL